MRVTGLTGKRGNGLFQEKIDYDGLHKNNGGNAKSELLVLGFVTEEVHAQESADAAAGDGQPDKGILGNAPLPSPGLPFVDAIKEEGQDVDEYAAFTRLALERRLGVPQD